MYFVCDWVNVFYGAWSQIKKKNKPSHEKSTYFILCGICQSRFAGKELVRGYICYQVVVVMLNSSSHQLSESTWSPLSVLSPLYLSMI